MSDHLQRLVAGRYGYYMSENMENMDTGVVAYQHCSTLNEGVAER